MTQKTAKRYRVHGTFIDDYSHTQATVEMVMASDYDAALRDLKNLAPTGILNGKDIYYWHGETERLRAQLREAVDDIASWGAYASEYFQDKHDLKGCIARHEAALAPSASGEPK